MVAPGANDPDGGAPDGPESVGPTTGLVVGVGAAVEPGEDVTPGGMVGVAPGRVVGVGDGVRVGVGAGFGVGVGVGIGLGVGVGRSVMVSETFLVRPISFVQPTLV
jgi:hypothetical protein